MARTKYPRFSPPLALAQAMAAAAEERGHRMTRAIADHAIDSATGWSLDLPNGSIRFAFDDHELVGAASLVGVFSKIGKTFTWGWSVDVPAAVDPVPGFDILAEPIVTLSEAQADGLAGLAFVATEDAFLYRAFGPAADTYVSVSNLRSQPLA